MYPARVDSGILIGSNVSEREGLLTGVVRRGPVAEPLHRSGYGQIYRPEIQAFPPRRHQLTGTTSPRLEKVINTLPGGRQRPREGNRVGERLRAKQRVREQYGMTERQFRRFFEQAQKRLGPTGLNLLEMLERRLDNASTGSPSHARASWPARWSPTDWCASTAGALTSPRPWSSPAT